MTKMGPWWVQLVIVSVVAVLLPVVIHFALGPASGFRSSDHPVDQIWSKRIPALMKEHHIEGSGVVILKDGRPVWSEVFGFADIQAERPLEESDLMMAHSISKSVTAWGVMRLVHEGKLDLDAAVSAYLRDEELAGYPLEQITTRQLLSMDAGVPLGTLGEHLEPGQKRPSLSTLLAEQAGARQPPGSGFEYSNLSYAFLELLIEEVTGRDFAEYMRKEVLEPLGMHDSGFEWRPEWRARVPTGYDLESDPVPVYLYESRAGGGLFSTLDDLSRFASASIDHDASILSEPEIAQMHRAQTPISGLFSVVAQDCGLGHFIEEIEGRKALWHGGQGLGWMTHFYVVPSTGDGIVIVSNSQKSWPFFATLLEDWSTWAGLPEPGMAVISRATLAMQIFISLLSMVSLWILSRISFRLIRGSRRFSVTSPSRVQVVCGMGALVVALGLGWALTRDYLFVSSIFPQETPWLWSALLATTLALIMAALTRPGGREAPQR